METVAWIGLAQSLFAATLIGTKKGSNTSDKILSGWLYLMAIVFLSTGLHYKLFNNQPLSNSFLLFNPALYLYIKSLTENDFKLKYVQLLHLVPFIFFEIYVYFIQGYFLPTNYFITDSNLPFRIAFIIINLLSWCYYNPLSIMVVHRHRMNLKNEFSNIESNENIGWILFVSIFYFCYCTIIVIIGTIVLLRRIDVPIPQIFSSSSLLLLVYALSYYGIRQKELTKFFNPKEISHRTNYKHSSLTNEQKREIKDKIIAHLEQKKVYLNPDLNMDLISDSIKVPKYQITEVLNTIIGKNFFQFVNQYRVEAVKKMLADKTNRYSIEAIGYDCGFSSKSSFYTFFKASTGSTPNEYKNKHSNSSKK